MTTPSKRSLRASAPASCWGLVVVVLALAVPPLLACSHESVPPATPRAQRLGIVEPPKLFPLKPREAVPARGFLLDAISITPLGPKRYLVEAWPDGTLDES